LKLGDWASGLRAALKSKGDGPRPERRREARRDFLGRKVVVRQRRALGIMHLRDLSRNGACGITDMPLAIGSIVFLELNRPHFHAAEVRWARNLRIGLTLIRPLRPDQLDGFEAAHRAARAAP
jgi:hypothetical protein